MKQYGMLQAIFMSFYSKKLYRDVAMNWGGYAFLYLLLIIALSWIVFTVKAQQGLNEFYNHSSTMIVEQIPVLTIKDGKVSTPENRPYVVMSEDKKERLAVIDVTGKYKNIDDANAPVLVTETDVFMQTDPDEIKKKTLPNNVNITVDPVVINTYAKSYLSYAWILMFPLMVLVTFFYRFIQVLIYSLIGKIFSGISSSNVPYSRIMLITMVALTPATVACTVFGAFNIYFPYQYTFYFLLTMLYLWVGIRANAVK